MGLKFVTEAADRCLLREASVVGEHSTVVRRCAVRHAGRTGSDYAGMSSDKGGEKPPHRKPKVS